MKTSGKSDFNIKQRLQDFVLSRSNILFKEPSKDPDCFVIESNVNKNENSFTKFDPKSANVSIDLPPLESFMNLASKYRRERLIKDIDQGDTVIASCNDVNEDGIKMSMICFDNDKKRDLSYVRLDIMCPIEKTIENDKSTNISSNTSEVVDKLRRIYLVNDLVRCVITDVDRGNGTCLGTLTWPANLAKIQNNLELGLVSSQNLPLHYQNIDNFEKDPYSYNKKLKRQRAFNNPAYIDIMRSKFNLLDSSNLSLMKGLEHFKIDKNETAIELHKQQNKNLALQSVQRGVSLFREGKNHDALLCYNKALSIDDGNVEAFVAKGALYANDGDFAKAIDDFKRALDLDSTHVNAKNYLKEVFIAYAVKLEKQEELDDSLKYLKKALEINPESEIISSKINNLKYKINECYNRTRYGPSLPGSNSIQVDKNKSNKKKKHKKSKKHSSSSSLSSFSSDEKTLHGSKRKISYEPPTKRSVSNDSLQQKQDKNRRSLSNSDDRNNKTFRRDSSYSCYNQDKKSKPNQLDDEDNDEDLEEFYLNLKKKQTNSSTSVIKK